MNDVWLGIIALAVVVMAAIQVAAIVFAARLARRVDRLATDFEQQVKPVLANLQAVTADAARAAAVGAAQIERLDRLFVELGARVEHALEGLHHTLLAPAREGFAVLSGIRAALSTLRGQARRRPAAAEEEDPLFIG